MMSIVSLVNPLLALVLSPLMLGIINRTKAIFAGRTGQPLLQAYYDLWRLFHKGAVYSRTTTWLFRAGPVVSFAVVLAATLLVPTGSMGAALPFSGDLVLLAYLFGLMRFMTVTAALDTGSSFEGMGASREVTFSTFCEPALLLGLFAVVKLTGSSSLSSMLGSVTGQSWVDSGTTLAMVAAAIFIVFLAENCRIPVDDPNTHLELTMIHEVMVLDHSGPDFGLILYAAAMKLWLLGVVLIGIVVPVRTGNMVIDTAATVGGMCVLAVITGIVESTMARLRLLRVPQLLLGASAFSILALIMVMR
jgi:formate hydrogenlyase subunit 4